MLPLPLRFFMIARHFQPTRGTSHLNFELSFSNKDSLSILPLDYEWQEYFGLGDCLERLFFCNLLFWQCNRESPKVR